MTLNWLINSKLWAWFEPHGLIPLGYRCFVSLIHPQNTASRRVAEKTGMPLEHEVEWKNKSVCVYAVERLGGLILEQEVTHNARSPMVK